MTLLVDVGTNAEIVLGNSQRLRRLLEPDGPGVRRRADQLRPARRARRDRARAHRPRDARAALQGHRLRSVVRRARDSTRPPRPTGITGVCGSGIIEVIAEMYLAGIINQDGVLDGRLAARSPRIVANGRTFAYVLHQGARGDEDHAERCARHSAGEGGAVCRHRAAHGAARHRSRRSHPARRRLRQPHRRQVRHHPRHGSGLRSGAGALRRQCRRHRRAHRAARCHFAAASSSRWCRRIEKVETAIEPRFQQHFVEAMAIPHKTATYTNLRKVVELPAPKESTSQSETRGRRPRRTDPLKTD